MTFTSFARYINYSLQYLFVMSPLQYGIDATSSWCHSFDTHLSENPIRRRRRRWPKHLWAHHKCCDASIPSRAARESSLWMLIETTVHLETVNMFPSLQTVVVLFKIALPDTLFSKWGRRLFLGRQIVSANPLSVWRNLSKPTFLQDNLAYSKRNLVS